MGDLLLVFSPSIEEDALRIIGDGDDNEDEADDWPYLCWNAKDDIVREYDTARRMSAPVHRFGCDGW